MDDDDDFISLAQPRDNPTSQAFRLLSDGLLQRGESEIRKALERSTGLQLEGSRRREMIDTLRGSGHQFGVRVSPDGAEAFYVDGRLVLTFEPTVLDVGADGVVVSSPALDHDLCLLERVENLAIQKFVPQASVEALDITVLPR